MFELQSQLSFKSQCYLVLRLAKTNVLEHIMHKLYR